MAKGASLQWTKGLPTKEAEELTSRLVENEDLLLKAVTLIDGLLNAARTSQLSLTDYSLPAWSEKQADSNGYQRGLLEVKQLLTLRE